ncbi:MAG: hypothetical protein AB7L09_01935 [Nitrospira sp.]
MNEISAKLGNMRSVDDWTVYPAQKDGRITIQAKSRIAVFDESGHGLLSKHCPGGAYFVHLSPLCGATTITVPQDVVRAALAAQSRGGPE